MCPDFIVRVIGNRYCEGAVVDAVLEGDMPKASYLVDKMIELFLSGKLSGRHAYTQLLDATTEFCNRNNLGLVAAQVVLGVAFWQTVNDLRKLKTVLQESMESAHV